MSLVTLETAVATAESAGWLDIDHGVSAFDPEQESRANRYRVTPSGHDQIHPLLRAGLVGAHSLSSPTWAERGGLGVRGLLLALACPDHFSTGDAAEVLGSSVATTGRTLRRWSTTPYSPLAKIATNRWFWLDVTPSAHQESRADERAEAIAYQRLAARYRVPPSQARRILAMQTVMLDYVETWPG